MAITLRPFRDYDEKDVVNLYHFSGTLPATKGTLVKIQGNGWVSSDEIAMLGSVGSSYSNTVSERYGVSAAVTTAGAADSPLGMMLFDVKETDENGEKLVFNPRKAAEMDIVLSGQAVPVVSRGVFLYSGTQLASDAPTAGQNLYCGANGEIITGNPSSANTKIGRALGVKDSDGVILVHLDIS
jgi:hypothetical protein